MVNNEDLVREDIEVIRLGDDLPPDIYNGIAERIANKLPKRIKWKEVNSSTQIRRFYDELVLWNDRVRLAKADDRGTMFVRCKPYVNMLVAKAVYAEARGLVSSGFVDLIRQLIRQIKNPETLRQGKLFLEAVIGFRKGMEGN